MYLIANRKLWSPTDQIPLFRRGNYWGLLLTYWLLQVDSYDVTVGEELGEIVLVKIEKKKYWVQDDWYCRYITVKTPGGEYLEFPCFRWLVDDKEVVLRDGRGT